MQLTRCGDGLAVCLPATVVEALGLKEGDEVDVALTGEREIRIVIAPAANAPRLERLRTFRGLLPAAPGGKRGEGRRRG